MSRNSTILEDLVCGMSVGTDEISADYQGNHYAFCSEQCRERFQGNPQRYTDPESNAPEPGKRDYYAYRTLKLAETLPLDVAERLTEHVRALMGIQYIEIYDDEIEMSYDPNQVTESQIETAICHSGEGMGEEWTAVLDRVFIYATNGSPVRNQNRI
ncbi:MAG: YHS domain-containing protein [Thiohalobacterales bacterium]